MNTGFFLNLLLASSFFLAHGSIDRKHYIVYMGSHSFEDFESVIASNHHMLASVIGSVDGARNASVHHYYKSFRGFSAMLTPQEAKQLEENESVISIYESKMYEVHTTRSWSFMGAKPQSLFGSKALGKDYDVIVGHLDNGVWPESPSYSTEGLGPPPKRWRGGDNCNPACNNKIIGMRYYYEGYIHDDPNGYDKIGRESFMNGRDEDGHGTHTSSIAVGSVVPLHAALQRLGNNVRGGAPRARLAVYKVCWFKRCSCADVIKGFDDAIHDRVDIITMSLGSTRTGSPSWMDDCFAQSSLHAFQAGILVSASAGNEAAADSVTNDSPWVLTVAASTLDREIVSYVKLANSDIVLKGRYAYNKQEMKGYHQIVYASWAAYPYYPPYQASTCNYDYMVNAWMLQGKVVVCTVEGEDDDYYAKISLVQNAGGVGIIIVDSKTAPFVFTTDLPTSVIDDQENNKLTSYIQDGTRKNGVILGFISLSEVHEPVRAPNVASFSSRGPGRAPHIIKPDITAPGADIFAAWPTPSNVRADEAWFNFLSGTSMACPHVSSVAALLKGIHPHWSPAQIKSAIITTTYISDNTRRPIQSGSRTATPFDIGSGHLNPNAALNPGLVYDFTTDDIAAYLCSAGVSPRYLRGILSPGFVCPRQPLPTYNLNYPSIMIGNSHKPKTVIRRVTYCGHPGDPSTFRLEVQNPPGIRLEVNPSVLEFSDAQKTIEFSVNVSGLVRLGRYGFGSITWVNSVHRVTSPVVVTTY